MACLEACVASLTVMTADDMPKEVANDDFILSIIAAVKNHLLVNVLVAMNPRAGHVQSIDEGELQSCALLLAHAIILL
jgi:hypothetical protein